MKRLKASFASYISIFKNKFNLIRMAARPCPALPKQLVFFLFSFFLFSSHAHVCSLFFLLRGPASSIRPARVSRLETAVALFARWFVRCGRTRIGRSEPLDLGVQDLSKLGTWGGGLSLFVSPPQGWRAAQAARRFTTNCLDSRMLLENRRLCSRSGLVFAT